MRQVYSVQFKPGRLSRKAQAALAFELKEEGFRLKDVLKQVDIPEATYHYHINQMNDEDPNKEWKKLIFSSFSRT